MVAVYGDTGKLCTAAGLTLALSLVKTRALVSPVPTSPRARGSNPIKGCTFDELRANKDLFDLARGSEGDEASHKGYMTILISTIKDDGCFFFRVFFVMLKRWAQGFLRSL